MDSGPSGAAARYLATLFDSGTAAGLGDRVLLERFADRRGADDAGAEAAFAALVERHGPMVLRVCRAATGDRHEAEDAFQATFLVLASRARSIRRGDSIGSWLHGVALRVAGRARWRAARRRHHEQRHAEMNPAARPDAITTDRPPEAGDIDRVLHEEIGRLPEKYRRPVVLCYLEGLTHDQAADQLGWPVGTVRRRLAGARDRLRGRLTRRGATLAVPLAPGLIEESARAAAAVPSGLAESTVRAALRVGTGQSAVAAASIEAVELMKEITQAMTTKKLIATATALLAACLTTTGAGILAIGGQQPGGPAVAQQQPKAQPPDLSPDDQFDALLRQYEDGIESNRMTPRAALSPAEKQARQKANVARLIGIEGQLLGLARRHPRTPAAEQALLVLVSYTVFGGEWREAYRILARDHARSDRIKQLLDPKLELYWASQHVEDLLHNASEQNPYREIRGLACYWLARVLEIRAEHLRLWAFEPPGNAQRWRDQFGAGDLDRVLRQDPKALEHRARRLLDRVINEYPFVANNDRKFERPPLILGQLAVDLPSVARIRLDALDRLSVGRRAPEIEGVDLDGRPMKLSDFRGKVVVLVTPRFLPDGNPAPADAPAARLSIIRRIAPALRGKPVALVSVAAYHRDELKQEVQKGGLPVQFWWDPDREGEPGPTGRVWGPRPGPIRTAWDAVEPNIYVIDQKGVIRYTHIFVNGAVEKAVATLLDEHEPADPPVRK